MVHRDAINCDCDKINSIATWSFLQNSQITTLYSVDSVSNEDGTENVNNNLYPTEFLNSLNVKKNVDINSG